MINSKELVACTKSLDILFVEDHDDLRETTTEILKNFFNIVGSAQNGEDAIEMYREYQSIHGRTYDIVLSDIQMPILNGIELTEQIYNINPSQIVIIISAYDDSKYLLPLINMGIEQFIQKPIDYQELFQVLYRSAKRIREGSHALEENSQQKINLSDTYIFERESNALSHNNENIYLTKYEIIFLQLLSTKVGKIYSNEDIVATYLSQEESIDAQNIRKLVSKLRKKLPDNALESIYGIGYRIIPYIGELA